MPAIPTTARSSSTPTGLFSPVFLYSLLAVFIVFVIILITVSNYRAMSRRNNAGQNNANTLWTTGPTSTSSIRPLSVPRFKPFLLRTDLALPLDAQLRPTAEKELTLVRGKRMSRPRSSSFEAPVQPPPPIYVSQPTDLDPMRPISVPKAAPPVEIKLDTPPLTPIVAKQPIEDSRKCEEGL
ncbi:unnamed protein product [Peniophora sp. CBMAI 1063]|nr:unnamed protein product [Peniophora sp. CBMAI 1063]